MTRAQGVGLALLAGLLWGTNPIFAKWMVGLTPLGMALARVVFAWAFLTAGIVVAGKLPQVLRAATAWRLWLFWCLISSVHWWLIMIAFLETSAGNAAMLGSLTPFFLLLLGPLLLKERIGWKDVLFAGVTFSGVVLIFFAKGIDFSFDTVRGDLAAVTGSFLFAIYTLIVRRNPQYPFYVLMFWLFAYAASLMGLTALIFDWSILAPDVTWREVSWGWMLLMGLVGTALGHCAYSASLRVLTSSHAALLSLLSPVMAYLWGWLLLGELVNGWGIAGMAVTVVGLALILGTPLSGRMKWGFWRKAAAPEVVPEVGPL